MSSNSSACRQSCLKPLIPEQDLSSSWSQDPCAENHKNEPCERNICGNKSISCWNFLQVLTNTSYGCRQLTNESEQVYVHPLTKLSHSALNITSLEMCTETLGSETGTSMDLSQDEYSYLGLGRQSSTRIKQQSTREFCKTTKYSSNFPPPLTSVSGSNGFKVQAHREGGRLLITAFTFSACRTYFKAKRENGRLRLSLIRDVYRRSEDELAEKLEEDGGKFGRKRGGGELSTSRCNGDGSGSKKLPSLPVCVAFS